MKVVWIIYEYFKKLENSTCNHAHKQHAWRALPYRQNATHGTTQKKTCYPLPTICTACTLNMSDTHSNLAYINLQKSTLSSHHSPKIYLEKFIPSFSFTPEFPTLRRSHAMSDSRWIEAPESESYPHNSWFSLDSSVSSSYTCYILA